MRITWLLFLFACFTAFGQLPKRPNNPPTAYNEFGKERLLSESEAEQIEAELRAFEEETSNAIVVVVVDDLLDMEIEQYADELGEAWGVGTAERDKLVWNHLMCAALVRCTANLETPSQR